MVLNCIEVKESYDLVIWKKKDPLIIWKIGETPVTQKSKGYMTIQGRMSQITREGCWAKHAKEKGLRIDSSSRNSN